MSHFYSDFFFCKNNFFNKPEKVIEFANSLEYNYTDKSFPGHRTENISTIDSVKCQTFANLFAKKLVNEIYTNIVSMDIDIRFHRYPIFADEQHNPLNAGWVHQDYQELAGVLYLNKLSNFNAGTSFYHPDNDIKLADKIREQFNADPAGIDQTVYLDKLQEYNSQYTENIKIGTHFNRLITYDAKLHHKPNDYFVGDGHRLTLLFVISNYEYNSRPFNLVE
jgi:hypothetical protein